MYRLVFWTLWEGARVAWFGGMALKHVYYHIWNGSPVQVQCKGQGAWSWCPGMTQRDGMGREVGGRFRIGDTCTPVADSCQCMAKPLQYCKVISLQLKWIHLFLKNQMHLMDYILNFNIDVFYKIYPQVLNLAQFCHYNPQINYEMSRKK